MITQARQRALPSLLVYCRRVFMSTLAAFAVTRAELIAFVLAAFADFLSVLLLLQQGHQLFTSHLIGFTVGFVIQSVAFATACKRLRQCNSGWRDALLWLVFGLIIVTRRTGVLAVLTQLWGWSPMWGLVTVVIVSRTLLFIIAVILTTPASSEPQRSRRLFRLLPLAIIATLAMLRLLYLGLSDLLVEEAYYWNYIQHPDWGYLDHPPMVAWVIGAGTYVCGHNEFAVRLGTFIAWFVSGWFLFKLARDLYDRATALRALMLFSSLPFFFGIGLIATPDAPLVMCWVATLYYLQRALIQQRSRAWLGVGVCLGLGLLSKYTIGLLIPASLVFILVDSPSRHWLRKPQPYLALILAGLLFTPVIYWNAQHEWVSFLFQSARRLREEPQFSLHLLTASALFLITPTGVLAAIGVLFRSRLSSGVRKLFSGTLSSRRLLFEITFCAIPLAVFAAFSLTHEPKLNWTGPSWLVLLPAMAAGLTLMRSVGERIYQRFVRLLWVPTVLVMTILYSAALNWLTPGIAGIGYPSSMKDVAGWKQLGRQVDVMVQHVTATTGKKPLVVGLDRYNISSEMAFYSHEAGVPNCAGVDLFDQNGLMYRYWFPPDQQVGRDIIMVARNAQQLSEQGQTKYFDSLSTVSELPVTLNNTPVGSYFARVGYGYKTLK